MKIIKSLLAFAAAVFVGVSAQAGIEADPAAVTLEEGQTAEIALYQGKPGDKTYTMGLSAASKADAAGNTTVDYSDEYFEIVFKDGNHDLYLHSDGSEQRVTLVVTAKKPVAARKIYTCAGNSTGSTAAELIITVTPKGGYPYRDVSLNITGAASVNHDIGANHDYLIKFVGDGTFAIPEGKMATASVFVVGGGAAGQTTAEGGAAGNGGAVVQQTDVKLGPGVYSITVGAGGDMLAETVAGQDSSLAHDGGYVTMTAAGAAEAAGQAGSGSGICSFSDDTTTTYGSTSGTGSGNSGAANTGMGGKGGANRGNGGSGIVIVRLTDMEDFTAPALTLTQAVGVDVVFDGEAHSPSVTYTVEPSGTTVTAEYRTSTDDGETLGDWSTEVPSFTDVGTAKVEYRVYAPFAKNTLSGTLICTIREKEAAQCYVAMLPTAAAITYGRTLNDATLTATDGSVTNAAGEAVVGTFIWKSASTVPTVAESGSTFEVTFVPASIADYKAIDGILVKVTVNRLAVTVTAENKSIKEGYDAPTFTATYSPGMTPASAPTFACDYKKGDPAGTYAITPSGAEDPNCTFTYVDGELTVIALTAKDRIAAEGADVTGTDDSPIYSFKGATGTLTIPEGYVATARILAVGGGGAGGTGAGSYSGNKGNGGNGGTATEGVYTLAEKSTLTFTIGAGGTVGTSANANGGDGVMSTVVSTDADFTTIEAAGGAGGTGGNQTSQAGSPTTGKTSEIDGKVYGTGGAAAGNQTAAAADPNTGNGGQGGRSNATANNRKGGDGGSGIVIVQIMELKRYVIEVAVVAEDKTVCYGDAEAELTVTTVPEVTGFTLPQATRVTGSDAGTYAITLDGDLPADTERYHFVASNGVYTITQAVLTATAPQNAIVEVGHDLPLFDIAYTGWKNGDDASTAADFAAPTASCPTYDKATSQVGDMCAIELTGGSARNYSFNLVNGLLTVTDELPVETVFKGKKVTTVGAEVLMQSEDEIQFAWKAGTGSLRIPELAQADILVVGAGGGAGGGYTSGSGSPYWGDAGSAGEVKEFLAQDLGVENEGGSFTITVGAGGAGGKGGSYTDTQRTQNAGKKGGDSSIGTWTAAGGVGGQSRKSDSFNDQNTSVAGCGASDLETPGSAGIVSSITGDTYGEGGAAATADGTATPDDAAANTGNGGDAPINPATASTGSTGAAGGSGYVLVRITDFGKKIAPVLSGVTATDIENGQSLLESTISGTAKVGDDDVDGEWSWQTPDYVPTGDDSDTTEFTVVFTPTDGAKYKVATATATVYVNQEITWKDKTFPYTGNSFAKVEEDGTLLFTFKGSGTITIPAGIPGIAADVLAVGAGGGGGGTFATAETDDGRGNGGDAGEVVEALDLDVAAGVLTVTVGKGGEGGVRPTSATDTVSGVGADGSASSVFGITANGGAGGACGLTYAECAAGNGAGEGSDATNVTLVVAGTFGAGGAKSVNHVQPTPTEPNSGNGGQAGSSQSDTAKQDACCPGRDGSDGYVVIRFKQKLIAITIEAGEGVEDVQTNGVSVVGDFELPADATEVTLTLEADPSLANPVFKVVRDSVTNETEKVATYDIKDGTSLEFIAEEGEAPASITITIEAGDGVADVQTNGVSVVGDFELPADTTEVELTLKASEDLTIPVFKVVRGNVTNVTTKVATYAIKDADTLEFFAEEAKEDDPTVTPEQRKHAIIDAIDPPLPDDPDDVARYTNAVAKVNAVVGDGADQVPAKDLAAFITDNSITSAELAESDYVAASVKLDTDELIKGGEDANTEIEFVNDASVTADGFVFYVSIDVEGSDVDLDEKMTNIVASCIQTTENLGTGFSEEKTVDVGRVEILDKMKVLIKPAAQPKSAEFFKFVIPPDPGVK